MPAKSLSDEYGDEHMIDIGCCGHTDTYLAISQMGYDYVELSARQLMELTESEFSDFLSLYGKVGVPCRGFNDYCSEKYPIVGLAAIVNFVKPMHVKFASVVLHWEYLQ